jgi:hypothetical protein
LPLICRDGKRQNHSREGWIERDRLCVAALVQWPSADAISDQVMRRVFLAPCDVTPTRVGADRLVAHVAGEYAMAVGVGVLTLLKRIQAVDQPTVRFHLNCDPHLPD